MAETSDLSGRPLAGDAPTTLEVKFPDGRRRGLRVRTDEAAELQTKGRALTGAGARLRRLLKAGRPFVKWVLVSVLGVLAVQAIAKQSADRQKELELKRTLASDLGSSSFRAFGAARTLAYVPQDQGDFERRLLILKDWIGDEGRIDGIFHAYFVPKSQHSVTRDWLAFRAAFYDYLSLSCCGTKAERTNDLAAVQDYLRKNGAQQALPPNESPNWTALVAGPTSQTYADAYDWLGQQVLRGAPFRAIGEGKPEGFSSGFGDFLHDAIPIY